MKTDFIILLAIACISAPAADWPQWRGPEFNGSSPEKNLPEKWSKTEGIAWQVDLPGSAAATPVIWQDRVFISSTDEGTQTLRAMCFDRKTGKLQWNHQVSVRISQDPRSTYASPSPATDGQRVVFFYGSGPLVCFDLNGEKLWERNIQKELGEFAFQWTFSTSPLLYDGKLYMQILQRDVPVGGRGQTEAPNESYLLALDPATGKTLWRSLRPSKAREESREAFTTPIPYEQDGRAQILIAGGDAISGHDPDSGEELWRWGTWNPTRITHWRLVPSPVAGDGVALACAPKGDPIYALPTNKSGDLPDSDLLWVSREERALSSDVPTPAFEDGDFFVLSDGRKAISRAAAKSGRIKWTTDLPGFPKFEASPTVADGKVYCMNFRGDVVVIDAEDGKILETIPMGERGDDHIRSSVAAAYGHLFIRTNSKLFCVGPK